MKSAIILAAGKGTRMVSKKNKVMHEILGKPLIEHVVNNLEKSGVSFQVVVVGHQAQAIQDHLEDRVHYAVQAQQLGTGHAIQQAKIAKANQGSTLIMYGDIPLVQPETIQALFKHHEGYDLTVATTILDDPSMYGRIIKDEAGDLIKIVEYKDASETERQIQEINTGIYCIDNQLLWKHIDEISNNNKQKEYYITDIVEIFYKNNYKINTMIVEDDFEVMGINDRLELLTANQWLQNKINTGWLKQGVTLIDPNSTYIDPDVSIGIDTIIHPNVRLEKLTKIGENCTIYSNSVIINSTIANNTVIDSSHINDSKIGSHCKIGPMARLRYGTVISDYTKIGNFVEIKNSTFGYNVRCMHLTYVGDSEVGDDVNLGCGVVTVNYDGKNKYKTIIEDGAFIGSNVNLIAPVRIGKNAVVAAGTTVNKDVDEGDMAIGRVRQENKAGYGHKYTSK